MKPYPTRNLGQPYLLSVDAKKSEVIVSSSHRATLLTGSAAQRLLNGERPSAFFEEENRKPQIRIEWEPNPIILGDTKFNGLDRLWSSTEELSSMLLSSDRHTYILSTRLPGTLLKALSLVDFSSSITPVLLYGHRLLVGPCLLPNRSPCGACWAHRLISNLPTLKERINRGHTIVPSEHLDLQHLLGTIRVLWEIPSPIEPPDKALVINLFTGEIQRQRLLANPNCHCQDSHQGSPYVGEVEDFVGDLLGIIPSVSSLSSKNYFPVIVAQDKEKKSLLGAACGVDELRARRRALSEAAERFAANNGALNAIHASYTEISKAPSLKSLMPFTDEQYASPKFPYQRLKDSSSVLWLSGCDLASGESISLPALLVTLDRRCGSPRFAPQTSTGIAASDSWPRAVEKAVLEVLERDIVTRAWYTDSMVVLDPNIWAPIETNRLKEAGVNIHLGLCVNDLHAPVVVAYVHQLQADGGAYGCAAGLSLSQAAPHAIEEAVMMLIERERRNQLCPIEPMWNNFKKGEHISTSYRIVDLELLIERYKPIVVDLTCENTTAVGLRVAAAWSSYSIDFPHRNRPLQMANWKPQKHIQMKLLQSTSLFTV